MAASRTLVMPAPLIGGALSDAARLTCDVCLSVAYIWPKLRTERPRKTKIRGGGNKLKTAVIDWWWYACAVQRSDSDD